MSYGAIRNALENRLKTLTGVTDPLRQIQWQNVPFAVPETMYLRATLLPAETVSPTQGKSETVLEQGIFQVDVVGPINQGLSAVEARAEQVRAHFPKALTLTSGGVSVQILRRASVGPTLPDNGRVMQPVSIPYFSSGFNG